MGYVRYTVVESCLLSNELLSKGFYTIDAVCKSYSKASPDTLVGPAVMAKVGVSCV